jgi:hypothetical protein
MLSLAREILGATFNGAFRDSRGSAFAELLAILFPSHVSNFKVPSDCYTMAAHRVLGLTTERASPARKCPRCNEAP